MCVHTPAGVWPVTKSNSIHFQLHLTNYLGFFLAFVLEILKRVGSAAPYSFALSYLCLLSLTLAHLASARRCPRPRTRSAARTVTADGRHECCHCIVIVTVVNVVVAIVAAAQ